jgi:chromosome segregation ATPase
VLVNGVDIGLIDAAQLRRQIGVVLQDDSGLQARMRTASEGQRATSTAQLQAEWQDITARLARLAAEQSRREAEIATVRDLIAKLEATLPIAQQREADIKGLAEQGFVAGHAGQDRTRERIEQERDLATQKARLAEAQAALVESANTRSSYLAETTRTLSDHQAQATLKRQQLTAASPNSPRQRPARCSKWRCTPKAESSRPPRC